MGKMEIAEALNADYIDAQYKKWKSDPESVSRDWQFFFKGFEIGGAGTVSVITGQAAPTPSDAQSGVEELIYRYRDIGHLLACMDPLSACPMSHPLLDLDAFGLGPEDLEKEFFIRRFSTAGKVTLGTIIATMKETYCRSVGVEYMHIQDPEERAWLRNKMEPIRNRPDFDRDAKLRILEKLTQADLFERFINKKYVGVTRFSLEGGDALIPILDMIVEHATGLGYGEFVLGMAHRGRLNVLANILGKPYFDIFAEFEHCYDPDQLLGAGDVKYHNGHLADLKTRLGHAVRIFLTPNPSHLEAVSPVIEGIARARQESMENGAKRVLPLLLHGDAAFAGQGIVAETLNMSQLSGYKTGGTIHVVINNQIGYTTVPEDARSTRYSTDMAKMLMVPIFHVHGENPEAAVHVAQLAVEYRNTFGKDAVIDLVCYRRYGHNEGDEPYFTQPDMYDRIRERPPLKTIYGETLMGEGLTDTDTITRIEDEINRELDQAFEEIRGVVCSFPEPRFFETWQGLHGGYSHEPPETGVDGKTLVGLARILNRAPDGFHVHPKLVGMLKKRLEAAENGAGIDWANAEALAFASLIREGHPVRLSGQDVGRGTFSQRHCVMFDRKTGEKFVPLNGIGDGQTRFDVFNSHLSESGVLGFEYGYSLIRPNGLTLWEAQFGDFANGAQTIIDLFIVAGQSKWQRLSGLILLLPHGWEGLGPEHSSARLERFLQLCAEDNVQVCNLTTPAQYFHALRRQIKSDFRKPLILMTPKSLLRHPKAVSDLPELTAGRFQPIINDPKKTESAERLIFCSGKVYYQLDERRNELGANDVAIVRVEQLYPFPEKALKQVLAAHKTAKKWTWVQEEPENMGGWRFIRPYVENILGKRLEYIGRKPSASPATGFPAIYKREQAAISDLAVGQASQT